MSKEKRYANFQLIGTVLGHPALKDAQRGDVLKLEVGEDGRPTSELLAARTRPVGQTLDLEGTPLTEKEAKGKAGEILSKAKADAAAIVDKAKADAATITQTATDEAAALIAAAGNS